MIEELNKLTRELTGFDSFPQMCNTAHTYRPTLMPTGRRAAGYRKLADAYDLVMECKGDERRAYRGVPYHSVKFSYIKLDTGDYDVYADGAYIGLVWHIGYGSCPWRCNRSNTGSQTRAGITRHLYRIHKGES